MIGVHRDVWSCGSGAGLGHPQKVGGQSLSSGSQTEQPSPRVTVTDTVTPMDASDTRDPALSQLQPLQMSEGVMQKQHQGPDLFRLARDGGVPNGHSPPTDGVPPALL